MKIRNKKTGEIREIKNILVDGMFTVNSLAELTENWEDYEEPKKVWWLDNEGSVNCASHFDEVYFKKNKEIGNYFETEEEAEKAVEKLKAWKRLKDAGFEFKGWKVLDHDSPRIYFNVYRKNSDDIVPFLDLLFGGENE